METSYPTTTIGDVARVRSGYAFKSKDWTESGIPVVKIANVKDGEILLDGCSFVSDETAAAAHEWRLRRGDILIAMTGYIGDVARVRDDRPLMLNQRVGRFEILNPDILDEAFFFYVLRCPAIKSTIEGLGYGSAQPNVSPKLIHSVPIPLPDIAEQRRIASILGSLDDKIEHNRRTALALERLARAIFKAWFVDFEPVKAKAAGATSFPSMPQEVFDALPAILAESQIGPVPDGWRVRSLADCADFLNGLPLQKYPPREDGTDLPVIKIAQLRKGSTEGSAFANRDVPKDYIIEDRDLIFSWSGTLEAEIWYGGTGALNQHLFKVTSDEFPQWLVFHWIRQHLPWFRTIAATKATTMGHIKRSHLKEVKVAVPPRFLLEAADEIVGTLYDLHAQRNLESRQLAVMRDYLLPRLMAGKINVDEDLELAD